MIQEFLQSTLPLDSSVTLKRSEIDPDSELAAVRSEAFEIVSDAGETVGFVKAWEEDPSFRGYVHFDSDGNVVDWKVFSRRAQG
ncbi:hypothetical protein [Marinobacter sp. Arc7-DN-1]|uniref:hypothetical protein n=1 Tax=Marinobacter sp. Arc7-DN-1 TaxID=2304594 RepID=UPI000E4343AE|nr:hypothetical protein [Marinobacter sp. Arc7-DN-1]AXS81837.1 hypothetical protein D0851_01475 [Marinobacter sp. Arc7-DN-1]